MSFALSYKAHTPSPTLFASSTRTAYASRVPLDRFLPVPPPLPKHAQNALAKPNQKQKPTSKSTSKSSNRNSKCPTARSARSARSVNRKSTSPSLYDALSLIDTYMCDASVVDFSIAEEECSATNGESLNPFAPLPNINLEEYRAAAAFAEKCDALEDNALDNSNDYQSICNSIKQSIGASHSQQADLRRSVISKVFSEDELIQLSNIFTEILESTEEVNVSFDDNDNTLVEDGDNKNNKPHITGTRSSSSSGSWDPECPTTVNGTPEIVRNSNSNSSTNTTNILTPISSRQGGYKLDHQFYPDDEKTPVNSDNDDDDDDENDDEAFNIPIGIDSSPVPSNASKPLLRLNKLASPGFNKPKNFTSNSAQSNEKLEDDEFDFSKLVDRHFSTQNLVSSPQNVEENASTCSLSSSQSISSSHYSSTPTTTTTANSTSSKILSKVRKIRSAIEFSHREIELISESWSTITTVNKQANFSTLNSASQKSLFEETSSSSATSSFTSSSCINEQKDKVCAYSFTKQFYNNLFRQMTFIKEFFPKSSTKKQIVTFGNILIESCTHLHDLNHIKKFLFKKNYMNSASRHDYDSEFCSKTIFGYSPINVKENEIYFSIFAKIFLRTLNENYPFEFSGELEDAWSKLYLFLFSCIVGGLKQSESKSMTKLQQNKQTKHHKHQQHLKKKQRVDSCITISIDDDGMNNADFLDVKPNSSFASTLPAEAKADDEDEDEDGNGDDDMETLNETTIAEGGILLDSNHRKNVDEIPLSVAAYRTSPADIASVKVSAISNNGYSYIDGNAHNTSDLSKRLFGRKLHPDSSSNSNKGESLFQKLQNKMANSSISNSYKSPVFQQVNPNDYVTNGKKIEKRINHNNLNNSDYYTHGHHNNNDREMSKFNSCSSSSSSPSPFSSPSCSPFTFTSHRTKMAKKLSSEDIKLLNKLRVVKRTLMNSKIFNKQGKPSKSSYFSSSSPVSSVPRSYSASPASSSTPVSSSSCTPISTPEIAATANFPFINDLDNNINHSNNVDDNLPASAATEAAAAMINFQNGTANGGDAGASGNVSGKPLYAFHENEAFRYSAATTIINAR